jgi:phosphoribosylaminoimidazole-succinocarboxamide synthase
LPLKKLSEGKTKIVYKIDRADAVLLKFKDSITALDGKKHDLIKGKGHINAAISTKLFKELERAGVPTHFIKFIQPDSMLVRKLNMIPIEVVCRNYAAGHLLTHLPMIKYGTKFKEPIIEFYLKNDALHDPILTEDHIPALNLATEREVQEIKQLTKTVSKRLRKYMTGHGLRLVDFKLEFGRDRKGKLRVGDELSGDSMRLWDLKTGKGVDKDLYRKGAPLKQVMKVYEEAYQRIVGRKL